jgi:Bacterial Ig-like domain
VRRLIALALLTACASMAPIPGGPEDHTPPKLIGVNPDTNSVNFHGNAVTFRFDEVVSDRSGPTQDLNGLFLISPRDGAPRIDWHRDRIDVRPKKRWLPNTAYSVTLLPGLADLSNNLTKYSFTLVFSTGPTLPTLGVVGRVFDWMQQTVAPNAIVEAIQRPDSVVYIARADSAGQFRVGPFGPGTYTVIAWVDGNRNFVRDPGEIWDSTQVKVTDVQPMLEMLAARRDTIGPAIASITPDDSVTLRVTLDKPLDPAAPLDTGQFRIVRGDSSRMAAIKVFTLAEYDTLRARARADSLHRADSLAALRDTTKKKAAPKPPAPPPATKEPEAPKPSKPPPAKVLIVVLTPGSHLLPLTQYRVTATDLVNLMGYKGTSTRVFATPKAPAKPDSTAAPAKRDTAAVKRPPGGGGPGGRGGRW